MDATNLDITTSDVKNIKILFENSNNKKQKNIETKENLENLSSQTSKKSKSKNILLILTDKPFTKSDLNSYIDLATYLKSDIITYFCNLNNEVEDLKKTIKNRILINKIFLHFLLKNNYNLPTSKINLFILGEFTCNLEALITSFYLQKVRKGNLMKKLKLKGLILENSIYLKETINFLFPQFNQKFIVPTFFIFGKFSVFSEEFLKEYKSIKSKFINSTEWLPEGGDMSNIRKTLRIELYEKIRNFLNKYENFKSKYAILLKNKNNEKKNFNTFCRKDYKEDFTDDITIANLNKRKSFIPDFDIDNLTLRERDQIEGRKSLKKKINAYFKKTLSKNSFILNKKYEEKISEDECICKLRIEKQLE